MTGAHQVALFQRPDFDLAGIGHRQVSRHLESDRLLRVRPGVFVWSSEVAALKTEGRAIVRARALALVSRHPPIFSHLTAAALHGLPVHGSPGSQVHVISASGRPSGGADVVRHDGPLDETDIVRHHGLSYTSLPRTVADVARTVSFTTAVCATDAALRAVASRGPGQYDRAHAMHFTSVVADIAHQRTHGTKKADRVLAFADGRAQLPAESVSRIHLVALGFPTPELQVHVPGPDGTDYWVDFGLREARALGEADGKTKYRDPFLRQGLSLEEVLDREKQREDWIRGTTQLRLARWGFEHLGSARALGDRLAAFGIRPPR